MNTGARELAAMAAASRKLHAFEATWARYVDALERLDLATASTGGHRRRKRNRWGGESRRLQTILVKRFGMSFPGDTP